MRYIILLLLSGLLTFGQAFTIADLAFLSSQANNTNYSLWISNTELKNVVLFMDANNTTTNYLGRNFATTNLTGVNPQFSYADGIVSNNKAFNFSGGGTGSPSGATGPGGSWLSLPSYSALENITNNFTAEWWAKATGSANDYCMFTRDSDGLLGYILGRGQPGGQGGFIKAIFSVNGSPWWQNTTVSTPSAYTIPNSWTHIAVVFETPSQSGSNPILRIYINAIQVASANITQGAKMSYNTAPLLISAYSGDNYHFDGLIDEIAFYATNLTSDQIFKIYQAGTNGSSKRFNPY